MPLLPNKESEQNISNGHRHDLYLQNSFPANLFFRWGNRADTFGAVFSRLQSPTEFAETRITYPLLPITIIIHQDGSFWGTFSTNYLIIKYNTDSFNQLSSPSPPPSSSSSLSLVATVAETFILCLSDLPTYQLFSNLDLKMHNSSSNSRNSSSSSSKVWYITTIIMSSLCGTCAANQPTNQPTNLPNYPPTNKPTNQLLLCHYHNVN